MKVFIHYKTLSSHETFEGTRLRKTLKGECELAGITWVDSPSSFPDLAHFIAPKDDGMLRRMKRQGVKTVVSAFYCENDSDASFCEGKEERVLALSKKTLRFLNDADLVLVPNEPSKKLAISCGVTSKIEVFPSAVNLARFEEKSYERDIFPRYFGIRPHQKIAVSNGSYADKDVIANLTELARSCPSVEFYFFGSVKYHRSRYFTLLKARRHAPANLHFESIVQDDVYRSALTRATAYLLLDDCHPDAVSLYEAYASKTQVVGLGKQAFNPTLKDGETCFLFSNLADMGNYLDSLYRSRAKTTIIAAYKEAEEHSLQKMSSRLKDCYEKLMNPSDSKEKEND